MIVISGGRVLTPIGWTTTDVLVDGEHVVELGDGLEAPTRIDARGCLVGPGLVDLHTHLREPGQTWKEDIASGSSAAAAGGFTAILAMPNTEPPLDRPDLLRQVAARGEAVGLTEIIPTACLTANRGGTRPSDVAALYEAGARVFSDDGDSVADREVLARVMMAVARLPYGVVAQHAEDPTLTGGGHMNDGELSRRLGIGGLPARAESEIVARDLELVRDIGVRYHCQHVSSRPTVELIRKAKNIGLDVTSEVTPHHLTFDESSVAGLDPDFKMYPPLRTADDRLALVDGLRDGTIDAVATDHAPHSRTEKSVEFSAAPRGVIGLETAASAVWEVLADPDRFFEVLSTTPARIAGLRDQGEPLEAGSTANLVIFDPDSQWVPTSFASKSSNSPYRGRTMRGVVRATVYRGVFVHQTGARAA